jgi:hypothetical protein
VIAGRDSVSRAKGCIEEIVDQFPVTDWYPE